MIKYISFPGMDEHDNVFVSAVNPAGGAMVKTASSELTPEVRSFIGGLKPDSSKLYVLVNALGSGEFYGSNVNGDYFEEDELLKEGSAAGYQTFLNAGVYRHHKNKDPEKSMGKVKVASYNNDMKRVELVVEIDREKAASLGHSDLVKQLDEGGNPAVSMGCKVKYDVCSVCDHKSKTRGDYCKHASAMMNRVMDDGQKVYVKNPDPRFFDISFVVVGADKTSYAMKKVAHQAQVELSADAAKSAGIQDPDLRNVKLGKSKLSDILKRVPATAEKIEPVSDNDTDLPDKALDRISEVPLNESLASLGSMGVILKPKEYQRVVLLKLGMRKLADRLSSNNQVFTPVNRVDRSVKLSEVTSCSSVTKEAMLPFMEERSIFYPILKNRVLTKSASSNKISPTEVVNTDILEALAAGYNGYRVELLNKIASVVENITLRDPDILRVIGENRLEDEFVFGRKVKTSGAMSSGVAAAIAGLLPLTYLYGAYVKKKRGAGLPVGPVDSFIEKHPNFSASMAIGLARLGTVLRSTGAIGRGFESLMGKF